MLQAMGYDRQTASSSLRLTVGRQTTAEAIDYTVNTLVDVVEKVRKLSREFMG